MKTAQSIRSKKKTICCHLKFYLLKIREFVLKLPLLHLGFGQSLSLLACLLLLDGYTS